PRTITFHLNPNARWHDGRPVRAEDVAFSFDVNTDSIVNSRARAALARVRRVTTRDSLTVVFHFSEAYPEMFYDAVHHVRILPARGDTSLPHPLFGDRQLRRALTLATDRQQLVQSVFGGLAKIPPGPMPLLWATWDSTLRTLPFDSAAAARILAANGWRDHDG